MKSEIRSHQGRNACSAILLTIRCKISKVWFSFVVQKVSYVLIRCGMISQFMIQFSPPSPSQNLLHQPCLCEYFFFSWSYYHPPEAGRWLRCQILSQECLITAPPPSRISRSSKNSIGHMILFFLLVAGLELREISHVGGKVDFHKT